MSFKSFVTETELADIKQKRQEEWEKTRRPDQPLGKALLLAVTFVFTLMHVLRTT